MAVKSSFDAIVVGAGPAGTSAALALAKRGQRVLLLERGDRPGGKNMFGGMLAYCPAPAELVPDFWQTAPWERRVVKRSLTVVGEDSSTSLVFHSTRADDPSLTGFTLFRPTFDSWYAERAKEAGVTLLTGCLVENLLVEDGRVQGVQVARPEGRLEAPVVIACDGALSLLAQGAGLHAGWQPSQVALGVRALYRLREEEINERFGVSGPEGATAEFLGCTQGVRGGGFVYTQTETLAVGLVMHLDSLKARRLRPYELLEGFVSSGQAAPLLKGAKLMEYSAHLLPEGGLQMVPRLSMPGLLLAGDAAALCYTNGLTQEGMNLALTSGSLAGEVAAEALAAGDVSRPRLSLYEQRLRESFVLRDMKTYDKAVELLREDRVFGVYPQLISELMEGLYRSDGVPKLKLARLGRKLLAGRLPVRRLLADIVRVGRAHL